MNKVVIIGGGTFNHVSCHLSLAAPAFGTTARQLAKMYQGHMAVDLVLTKMADHTSKLITSEDVVNHVLHEILPDKDVKIIVMNAAMCDFTMKSPSQDSRLSSQKSYDVVLEGIRVKLLDAIKTIRPDIVVAGFKTTHGASYVEQVWKARYCLQENKIDIVLANDVQTRSNMLLNNRYEFVADGSRELMLEQLVYWSLEIAELKE